MKFQLLTMSLVLLALASCGTKKSAGKKLDFFGQPYSPSQKVDFLGQGLEKDLN